MAHQSHTLLLKLLQSRAVKYITIHRGLVNLQERVI
jgi:hypothetical protein